MIWLHVDNWGEVGKKRPKLIANETLYQLSYSPKTGCAGKARLPQRLHYVLLQGWGKLIPRDWRGLR